MVLTVHAEGKKNALEPHSSFFYLCANKKKQKRKDKNNIGNVMRKTIHKYLFVIARLDQELTDLGSIDPKFNKTTIFLGTTVFYLRGMLLSHHTTFV